MGNPNWQEAPQLAIYKRGQGIEHATRRTHNCQCVSFSAVVDVYNPPINFDAILLATLRHVVKTHETVITQ